MKKIRKLKVSICLADKEIEVGELVEGSGKIYFKYYSDFIETGIQISPFKMPLSTGILSADTNVFDGLFGVFDDSLPDGWGRLLVDRTLIERGISLNEITPLDRLSMVGNTGMGSLIYQPMSDAPVFQKELELDRIATESKKILEGKSTDIIEELVHLGGSSGGARPKIFVGYHENNDHLIYGEEKLPAGYEHWILKFSSASDPKDMAQIEYAYYLMAKDAGLEMSKCRLFQGVSGNLYFGTKRFDRSENKRIHIHSAAGLMHDNFRLSNMDYGHIMDAAFQLGNHVGAYEKILRLATFNVFSHNRDDHSKNISFLMDDKGEWKLAPAYDLTFSFSSHGFHSTTVAGEGKSPGRHHLVKLANIFGVKNAGTILEQVRDVTKNWQQYAKESGVSGASMKMIEKNHKCNG